MDGHKFRVAFVYTQLLSSALVRVKLSFIDEDGSIVVETPLDEVKVQLAYRRIQDWFSFIIKFSETNGDVKTLFSCKFKVIFEIKSLCS